MAVQPGDTIGDYRVIELLGSGGMGHVYKVQNTFSNRIEAMKVLLPGLSTNSELAGRFLREIQVQASLVHPNIAALYTAFQAGDQLVMLMEYVEGETLETHLRRGPMAVEESLLCATQVLSALAYAHRRGVIHRDIKPANVILSPNGAKLMDFGLAAVGFDRRLTRTGTVMGSLSYMAPEQVRGQALTVQSDIYSFGLTLYETLTGVRGITGDSDYAIMTGHLDVMPPAPAALNPSIPPAVSAAVQRAIAKNAADRFPSAEAFSAALTAPQPSARAAPPPPANPALRRARHPLRWTAAAISAVLLVGVSYYFLSSTSQGPIDTTAAQPPLAIEPGVAPQPAEPRESAPADRRPPGKAAPPATKAPPASPLERAAIPSQDPPVAVVQAPPPPVEAIPPVSTPALPPAPTVSPAAASSSPASPPAATPAAPPAPAPAPAIPQAEVNAALRRLETAYAARDMSQVRAAFPGITPDHAARLEQFFKATRSATLRLEPAGAPRLNGEAVVLECRHWLTARFRDGGEQRPVESRALIRVTRFRGAWVVDAMEFTQRGRSLYPPL
jgi:serine/threonine-protein kinase